MSIVFDIWSVLTSRQRRWVVGAQFLSIAMALTTVVGIASIAPFFAVLGNPHLIDRSGLLNWLYLLGFSNRRSFMVALGLSFMGLVLLANLINVVGSYVMIAAGVADRHGPAIHPVRRISSPTPIFFTPGRIARLSSTMSSMRPMVRPVTSFRTSSR